MGIFAVAKKKLGFRNGDTGEILTVEPFEYATLPDWVEKDPLYGWAVADGSLEVPKQEKQKKPEVPKKPEVSEKPPESSGKGDK